MKKSLIVLSLLGASAAFAAEYSQVVFSENFDAYPVGEPLPSGDKWRLVEQRESADRFARIQADRDRVFGEKGNQYLQLLDAATNGAVRVAARLLADPGVESLRLSFDLLEPENGFDGSSAIRVGGGLVDRKKKEAVNGIKVEGGRLRPREAGTFRLGRKTRFDLWFNEAAKEVVYTGPDGNPHILHPGLMDVWMDGTKAIACVSEDRDVDAPTRIQGLRVETFSSSTQEIWLDNIEAAVPEGTDLSKKRVKREPDEIDLNYLVPAGVTASTIAADHALVKERYTRFLIGDENTFAGPLGPAAAEGFLQRVERPIERALSFDFKKDADKTFRALMEDPAYKEEAAVYSPLLEQYLLALAYGYTVDAPGSPYYKKPEILECYMRCLAYLYGRGVRDGVTFHYNANRMRMDGAPRPTDGAGNLVKMELRMGAYCQSVLLMEPYFSKTKLYVEARKLVRHLEMLGKTSGHVRYYEPFTNPGAFRFRAQSDAIQNYGDTTLVSALLETDSKRRAEMLLDARRVFTDSLKVIPGWADTIKPDFTGFHHRGIYGNAYTGGFIPQASFGVWVLRDTKYAVVPESVENVKKVIETYRLYCQKYAMPFGIRGRMPLGTHNIKTQVFPGILIYASALGLDDAEMRAIYKRLWDPEAVGLDFLFTGGRGKIFRGMYCLNMLEELETRTIEPEADPNGFWVKPYGGLAIHRRGNWMAAVKGYGKYVWDYENGSKLENVYGQYFSHGSLTIFSQGDPVNDIDSGYNLNEGWDWYRMPGTTAVRFPIKPSKPLEHREFSPETFLGGATMQGRDGVFAMKLSQERFGDGARIDLKANKSYFFVDDTIVMLGSDISGGDGEHAVETTLFQSYLPTGSSYSWSTNDLIDPSGNAFHIPEGAPLKTFLGVQNSYRDNGVDPSSGRYATAWFDHGTNPENAEYEAAIVVGGGEPEEYHVIRKDHELHQVYFPRKNLAAYVFYRGHVLGDPIIQSVDEPCVMLLREEGERLRISLANPDLGLLDKDAATPDFRFINDPANTYRDSAERPVELTLKGRWSLKNAPEAVKVIPAEDAMTRLRFACAHGMELEIELVQE